MISVIVPVHNTEKYLKECLNSIIKQTYSDLEILCIDSSTDKCPNIIESFARKDKRVIHIIDSNSSYGYKINKGIQLAKGEYIGIIDSDDYADINFYKDAFDEITSEKNIDFVKFDYYLFSTNNNKRNYIYYHNLIEKDYYNVVFSTKKRPDILSKSDVSIWSGLYRKDFIIKNRIKLFESPGASFQDTGFSIFTHLYSSKIKYIEKPRYFYRSGDSSASSASDKKPFEIIDEYRNIESKIKKDLKLSKEEKKQLLFRKIGAYWWNIKSKK